MVNTGLTPPPGSIFGCGEKFKPFSPHENLAIYKIERQRLPKKREGEAG
jgi:hypothetical protein